MGIVDRVVRCTLTSLVTLASLAPLGAVALDAVERTVSPLLAIDRNRATVVDRIVTQWGAELAKLEVGVNAEALREMLLAMRADQLLAASLAGSLEGVRNVIASALVSDAQVKPSLLRAKALGDVDNDVVYVPVTPCRLVETRGTFPAVYQGGGAFAGNEIRTYTLQGGNGVCLTQLPSTVSPSAIQLQVYGIPNTGGSGDIEVLPQGGTFGSTATLVYLGNNAFTSSAATSLVNTANKQISVQVRGAGAHVAIDVVGFFRPPDGGFVSTITAGAGLTGGGSGATSLAVDTAVIQSRVTGTCVAGSSIRAVHADGSVTCEMDDTGTGTVTSVATGTGLTGGPITTTGTVSIAPGGVGTTQLADGAVVTDKLLDAAVTLGKLAASGGVSGQSLTTNGTSLAWQGVPAVVPWAGQVAVSIAGGSTVFVFVGPTGAITVPTGAARRVTGSAHAVLALAAGTQVIRVNLCYQLQPAGAVTEFDGFDYLEPTASTTRTTFSASHSVVLGAGTYAVGLCVRNFNAGALNVNDWTQGWVMVTAP